MGGRALSVPVVRLPLVIRLYLTLAVLLVGGAAAAVAQDAARRGAYVATGVAALVCAGAVVLYVRVAFARLILAPDDLTLRNFWRTLSVPRAEILGFDVQVRYWRGTAEATVRVRGGATYPVHVLSLASFGGGRRWRDRTLDLLSEWGATGTVTPRGRRGSVPPAKWTSG